MKLEKGDLLFIYRGNDKIDEAIAHIFRGYNDLYFNHVGIYVGHNQVIEAISPCVRKQSLALFLETVGDEHPVIVAKTDPSIKRKAVVLAESYLGRPYNDSFVPSTGSFYCSSLIHDVFRIANDDQPYFKKHTMSFKDIRTDKTMPFWIDYYQKRGLAVPEGEDGSHPSNLSLDSKLYDYFELKK